MNRNEIKKYCKWDLRIAFALGIIKIVKGPYMDAGKFANELTKLLNENETDNN